MKWTTERYCLFWAIVLLVGLHFLQILALRKCHEKMVILRDRQTKIFNLQDDLAVYVHSFIEQNK